jgi:hypothetical protein
VSQTCERTSEAGHHGVGTILVPEELTAPVAVLINSDRTESLHADACHRFIQPVGDLSSRMALAGILKLGPAQPEIMITARPNSTRSMLSKLHPMLGAFHRG